jgi:nucleotide-binding universal stress UspA family protein
MEADTTFAKVIVGVDGRTGGRDAIALARMLVGAGGRLLLANVHTGDAIDPGELAAASQAAGLAVGPPSSDAGAGSLPGGRSEAERLLEQERTQADVDAESVPVAASSIGRGLHQLAEGEQAELVVVGSSHRGFLGRVFIGDDTRAALNGSPCAIAVAPLGYAQGLAGLREIGVGYDGSPESDAALALAKQLGREHGGKVTALRVVQILSSAYAGFGGVAWGDALETVLNEAKEHMEALTDVRGEAKLGVPGEELAEFGERVDLLVVGSRAYGPLRRLMLGSTSQYLAAHARCPLLVLPRTSVGSDGGEPGPPGAREQAAPASG